MQTVKYDHTDSTALLYLRSDFETEKIVTGLHWIDKHCLLLFPLTTLLMFPGSWSLVWASCCISILWNSLYFPFIYFPMNQHCFLRRHLTHDCIKEERKLHVKFDNTMKLVTLVYDFKVTSKIMNLSWDQLINFSEAHQPSTKYLYAWNFPCLTNCWCRPTMPDLVRKYLWGTR